METAHPDFFNKVGNMLRSTKRSRDEDDDELEQLRYDHKVK